MRKRILCRIVTAAVFLFVLAASAWAAGEEAADITSKCKFSPGCNSKTFKRCRDRDYTTYWQSENGKKAWIEVTVPGGREASGVWTQWYDHSHAWGIQIKNVDGEWTDWAHTDGSYLSEYLALPEGTKAFRIANAPGNSKKFRLAELRIFGPGEVPSYVHRWEEPAAKADLMLLAAHPDDEVLWFGGALPRYAGEEGRACQVCMLVPTTPYRRLELLDSLWTCGVRNYPVWGNFSDFFGETLKDQYTRWSRKRVYETVTEWIRRFKPDVLLTHDIRGESGHGAHQVCADAVTNCLEAAGDKEKYRTSAEKYGVWEVPKCYLHLYVRNVVDMDWRQPLSAFGGKTGFDVAEEAFACHVSQQNTKYKVRDSGLKDNSLFGLYSSLVGDDISKDDFFENID